MEKLIHGYYSLIQFSPDESRSERVNVGVLLFSEQPHFIDVLISDANDRAKRILMPDESLLVTLNRSKKSFENRIRTFGSELAGLEDLNKFVSTRANLIRMTSPRQTKFSDPAIKLKELFERLVEPHPMRHPVEKTIVERELDPFFNRLAEQGLARLRVKVELPVFEREVVIPYVFDNDFTNLVKPYRFSEHLGTAMKSVLSLAAEGDLLYKEGIPAPLQNKLVVVAEVQGKEDLKERQRKITDCFRRYNVDTIHHDALVEFKQRVRQHAHK